MHNTQRDFFCIAQDLIVKSYSRHREGQSTLKLTIHYSNVMAYHIFYYDILGYSQTDISNSSNMLLDHFKKGVFPLVQQEWLLCYSNYSCLFLLDDMDTQQVRLGVKERKDHGKHRYLRPARGREKTETLHH